MSVAEPALANSLGRPLSARSEWQTAANEKPRNLYLFLFLKKYLVISLAINHAEAATRSKVNRCDRLLQSWLLWGLSASPLSSHFPYKAYGSGLAGAGLITQGVFMSAHVTI
ncbi:hypothetical protein [Pseudomonas syringae]|uniref:hypothetical protein n=1 Tax=Pseudomonas syringae TaxID=317 RepID=UPI0011875708|nr:hypothetical protein [Pseudomonas syringae]